MKKLIIFILPILAMMSCQNEETALQSVANTQSVDKMSGIQKDIMINILSTKFGGYHAGQLDTRAMEKVSVTPYIEDGDTLMYIVQYEEGWELYSANKAAHMVLCSSEVGEFHMNDPKMPSAMKEFIAGYIEELKELSNANIKEIDSTWGNLVLTDRRMDNGTINVHKNGISKVIRYPEVPSGTWILIGREQVSSSTNISEKLTETYWEQESPWNNYAKLVLSDKNEYIKGLAGCVPVALGQYMYHTHYLNNVPSSTVDTAVEINGGLDYTFSGNSTEIWDKMAKRNTILSIGVDEVAIFLGYIGRQLNANYGNELTEVNDYRIPIYLKDVYSKVFTQSDLEYSYIKLSIDNQYPVIAHATTNIQTKSMTASHLFLIDQYKEESSTTKNIYGLIRDPWTSDSDDPYEDNLLDDNGNVLVWAYTKEVINTSTSQAISMNWGEGFNYDESYFSPYASDWIVGSLNYNKNRWMYKREDVK